MGEERHLSPSLPSLSPFCLPSLPSPLLPYLPPCLSACLSACLPPSCLPTLPLPSSLPPSSPPYLHAHSQGGQAVTRWSCQPLLQQLMEKSCLPSPRTSHDHHLHLVGWDTLGEERERERGSVCVCVCEREKENDSRQFSTLPSSLSFSPPPPPPSLPVHLHTPGLEEGDDIPGGSLEQ